MSTIRRIWRSRPRSTRQRQGPAHPPWHIQSRRTDHMPLHSRRLHLTSQGHVDRCCKRGLLRAKGGQQVTKRNGKAQQALSAGYLRSRHTKRTRKIETHKSVDNHVCRMCITSARLLSCANSKNVALELFTSSNHNGHVPRSPYPVSSSPEVGAAAGCLEMGAVSGCIGVGVITV